MEYRDYYKILNVDRNAKADEIKKSYRKLARKYHPDVSKEANAEDRFKEVQEAYEVLKDSKKRASYDQLGNDWKNGQDFRPPPSWEGFGGSGGAGFRDAGPLDFSDFFESLFGQRKAQPGFGRAGSRGRSRRAPDEQARIAISMEDAYKGGARTIQLQGLGPSSSVRTLKVTLPAGILPGKKLRLAKQGAQAHGMEPGDLYLEIILERHSLFTLDGRDVTLILPVTPWECALGKRITAPTLGGKVDVKIAAGSQSGQKLRLKGRGFPGNPPGDQYVILKMMTAPAETAEQKQFYEKMADEIPFDPRVSFIDFR